MNATLGSSAIGKLMDIQELCNHARDHWVETGNSADAFGLALEILEIIKAER